MDEQGYVSIAADSATSLFGAGTRSVPRELEDILQTHPAVLDVCVVGVRMRSSVN